MKVRPAVSLTENVVPDGKQSQPTIITSFGWVVVRETLHVVTYPHPVEAEPSIIMLVVTVLTVTSSVREVPLAAGLPVEESLTV
jgi:hypothetical protein